FYRAPTSHAAFCSGAMPVESTRLFIFVLTSNLSPHSMPFIMHALAKAGINGFFFLLIFSILLAWAFPEWGMEGSRVPFDEVTYYGVAAIFFFYGVKLSPESLKLGLS